MKLKNNHKTKLHMFIVLLTGFVFLFVGCSKGAVQEEEENLVVVDVSEDEMTFRLETIGVGDVILTQRVNATYVQTSSQEVSFSAGGKIVTKVYVHNGDSVKPGDLLVELDSGNLEEEIATLEYKIAQDELSYGYLDVYEDFELQNAYFSLAYNSKQEEDDVKAYDKAVEKIHKKYKEQREDYEDSLYFDRIKLSDMKTELDANRVYATMSGTVIEIKSDLEGSTAKRGDVIMKVVDNSNGLFETQNAELVQSVSADAVFSLSVVYGDAKGEYLVSPFHMDSWGDTQTFSIEERPENGNLEVGTSATITVVIDSREDVLCVSREALYEVDGRYYVYTLDADNMREVRFVEIGLYGDNFVEITGGITEGEKVIKR